MTVKELIEELKKYNQDAEVQLKVNTFAQDFFIDIKPSNNEQVSHTNGTLTYKYKVVLQAT